MCWYFFVCPSLSFFLLVSCSMAPKWKSTPSRNPLHSGASSSSPFADSTPSHARFRNDKAHKDFLENFSWCSIHSEHQIILLDFFDTDLPIVIYSKGWESLCGILINCPSMIIQEFYSNMHGFDYSVPHFITRIRGTLIVVTLDLISKVLHVPRVEFINCLGYDHLRTMSNDELSSRFCETPSSWGDHQNTLCSGFAKGLRFLNMVMTFALHLLSHYNSITGPHAQFLLSLLEGLTIDFPSHFILSLIDVYRDRVTCDKLIFSSVIMRILYHFCEFSTIFLSPILSLHTFLLHVP